MLPDTRKVKLIGLLLKFNIAEVKCEPVNIEQALSILWVHKKAIKVKHSDSIEEFNAVDVVTPGWYFNGSLHP